MNARYPWTGPWFTRARCSRCGDLAVCLVVDDVPAICRDCADAERQAREVEQQLIEFFDERRRTRDHCSTLQDLAQIRAGFVAVNCPRPCFVVINHAQMRDLYTDVDFQRLMVAVRANQQVETLKLCGLDDTKHAALALLFGDLYIVLRLGS